MKILLLAFTLAFCQAFINQDYGKIIEELSARVAESQAKEDTDFIAGVQWARKKGEYPSYIMFNYFGEPEEVLLRENLKIYDSNAFITQWITVLQLEAALFPGGPALEEKQLFNALDVIESYQDRNREKGSSMICFNPQKFNETTGLWVTEPINLAAILADEQVLSDVLVWLLGDLDLTNYSQRLREFTTEIQEVYYYDYHFPPDADDTFVNIGLGSLLHKYKGHNTAYSKWLQANPNISNAIFELLHYSYQPFGDTLDNSSIIDPRSYFYLRNFLYKNENLKINNLRLPAVWMSNFNENVLLYDKQIKMPFNLNSVDLTVSADILYGITAAVLSDIDNPELWFDASVQTFYWNIVDMITYELQTNLSSRPDLALSNYSSKMIFYWYVSRTLQLLKSSDGQTMYPVMEKASRDLETSLRNNFTDTLIKFVIHDTSGLAYCDEFLGNNDEDLFGNPVNHAEDRIFCTSMAANTLLYTWREGINLSVTTPPAVITTVQQLCNWLAMYSLSGHYKPHSALFSSSVKNNYYDMPYFFPANYQHLVNGTSLPKDIHHITLKDTIYFAVGMLGMMDEDEYNLQLKVKHFGEPTPFDFPGYNSPGSHFQFYASDEITYSSVILALTQCQYLFD